ncbi:hypothetical protein [Agromyces flavus]|nr:hypothetical protein [Agromyces flavus]
MHGHGTSLWSGRPPGRYWGHPAPAGGSMTDQDPTEGEFHIVEHPIG